MEQAEVSAERSRRRRPVLLGNVTWADSPGSGGLCLDLFVQVLLGLEPTPSNGVKKGDPNERCE